MSTKPTIAFLGATGGCAGFALANALNNGHQCRALARTPEKLRASLQARGANPDAIDRHLVIVQGNAKDENDIKRVLLGDDKKVVDKVVSGIGGAPQFEFSLKLMSLDDPSVCQVSAAALVSALNALATQSTSSSKKPDVVAVSTTGITSGPRDVPLLFTPLYKLFLHEPHVDKVKMEKLLRAAGNDTAGGVGSTTIVRASLLTDGAPLGVDNIRVGKEADPAIGYFVSRADVGAVIYDKLVKTHGNEYAGEALTVTN